MGKGNNRKYDRHDVEKIVRDLGFEPDTNNGKIMGKGAHIVYSHKVYQDLKINIPTHNKSLGENEMSDICAVIIIAMKILSMDTSVFTHKEDIEGKLKKMAKNAEKDITVLFTRFAKNCLGLTDEQDILEYIEQAKQKVQQSTKRLKR